MYHFLCVALAVARLLPYTALRIIVCVASPFVYLFARRDREIMRRNLLLAYPEESRAFRERIARRVFLNFGRMAVDLVVVHRRRGRHLDRPPRVRADWKEAGRRMTERGAVGVAGHLGSWELLAAVFSLHNPGRLGVVARRIYFPPFNDLVAGLRYSFGIEIFYQDESPRAVIRHLRGNNVLGILPDQDVRDLSGIFVPFFGVDAWTPTGPAALSLTTGAPIFIIDVVWERDCYHLILDGPFPFPNTGSRAGDIRSLTEEWTRRFEQLVRTYPDQWAWFHRRWKTRPEDRAAESQ